MRNSCMTMSRMPSPTSVLSVSGARILPRALWRMHVLQYQRRYTVTMKIMMVNSRWMGAKRIRSEPRTAPSPDYIRRQITGVKI